MSRTTAVTQEKAQASVKTLYETIQKKMGVLPNIFQHMGHSPLVLEAYLSLSEKVSQTHLSPKLREELALVVSQANQCNYCLAAHTKSSKRQGIPDQEILLARKGESKDPKTQAILRFAKTVVEKRGRLSDVDVTTLKEVGVTDEELAEVFLNIMLSMFTNYFNNVFDPPLDFPAAPSLN